MFGLFSPNLEAKRRRLVSRLHESPLKHYLEQPFPDAERDYREITYMALDLETTGLDPKKDAILSFGFVALNGKHIDLSTAQHVIIAAEQEVLQSATIHGLTDDAISAGSPLEEAMTQVLDVLQGKVLLAHHAVIETGFLNNSCKRLYKAPFLAPVVDTVKLERQSAHFQQKQDETKLRLAAARETHGLPRYKSHNALTDAVACAELFLSQAADLAGDAPKRLRDFL